MYDSFFIKGQSHDICQDYALSNSSHNMVYAMISDGCSMINHGETSIPHPSSDIGSRIVCLSAEKILKSAAAKRGEGRVEVTSSFLELLGAQVRTFQKLMDTPSWIGDATLSLVSAYRDIVCVRTIGDGVTVIEEKDGITRIQSREYTPNFPEYVSYLTNLDTRDRYYNEICPKLIMRETIITKDGNIEEKLTEIKPDLFTPFNIDLFLVKNLKSISVFSDGIEDMIDKSSTPNKPVDLVTAVTLLTDIKNPTGMFVRRKLKSIARKQANGIGPGDDLSMAMIRFD